MTEDIKVVQEYPKYIQLENGYKIVNSKEEEDALIKPVKKEEKNERTSKDNSQGANKKKSNTGGSAGTGGESN